MAKTYDENREHCKGISDKLDLIVSGRMYKCPDCGALVDAYYTGQPCECGCAMDINEWEVWYAEILETLGFSREGDEKTADLLDEILDKKGCLTIDEFFDEIMDKKCTEKFIVFGAGPSLKKHINFVKENYDLNDSL